MKLISSAAVLAGFVALVTLVEALTQPVAKAEPREEASATAASEPSKPVDSPLNPTALEDQATQLISTYCVSCHGPDKQEGSVRLGALETIDAVDRQTLFAKMQELVQLNEMPPEESRQPSDAERAILLQWLDSQLLEKVINTLE